MANFHQAETKVKQLYEYFRRQKDEERNHSDLGKVAGARNLLLRRADVRVSVQPQVQDQPGRTVRP